MKRLIAVGLIPLILATSFAVVGAGVGITGVSNGKGSGVEVDPDEIMEQIQNKSGLGNQSGASVSINSSTGSINVNGSKIRTQASISASVSVSVNKVSIDNTGVVNGNTGHGVTEVSVNISTPAGVNKEIKIVRNQTQNKLQVQERINQTLLNASTQHPVMFKNSKMYMNTTGNVTKEVKYMPSEAIQALNQSHSRIKEMEMIADNQSVKYKVNHQKMVRLFGLLPMNMSVSSEVDAETGTVGNEKRPWWSFLTTE